MDPDSTSLVRKAFSRFYATWQPEPADRVAEREFGYVPMDGFMRRHMAFKTLEDAAREIRRVAPLSAYMSNAFYERPADQPMEAKGWLGTQLDIDIDADHVESECRDDHDVTVCAACFATLDKGAKSCKCGSKHVKELHWFCKVCLGRTKDHARRAMDYLVSDFGVDRSAISLYFSGNRGYHVHVDDRRFVNLDSPARNEVSDYMIGNGLALSVKMLGGGSSGGWYGRLRQAYNPKERKTGVMLPGKEMVNGFNVEVDPSVTNDIHRILRMPNTLHGSSGMLKLKVADLAAFDPFTDPVALDDEIVPVHAKFSPVLEMQGKKFGPYGPGGESGVVSLPKYAAVYLVLKGLATAATV
nr:DNA primase small subunit domain-containing protein [Ferrimicrobium acidiphilum]